jgi:hypothetical protein
VDAEFLAILLRNINQSMNSGTSYRDVDTNAWYANYAGSNEMVIVKLNSNLTSLLASTYLGGDTQEYPLGFAFDGDGNPLVYGQTNSTNYPVSTGAFLTTEPSGGVYQAMATRLSTDLTSLHASAFIDKPLGFGSISSFYLENDGNFVFSGNMAGPGAPTTHGAYSTNSAGSSWVGRFSPSPPFNVTFTGTRPESATGT